MVAGPMPTTKVASTWRTSWATPSTPPILESVPEGADAERVIRNLARAGFNAIFTTSFGYMDSTEVVAEEFPDTYFVHVSGFKKNETNFANLFGGMESMKYLVGMIAGAAPPPMARPPSATSPPSPFPK